MFLTVALFLPGLKDFLSFNHRANALVKTLSGQYGMLDFGYVEPASMFRRVVNLEFLDKTPCLLRGERLVE